MCTAAEILKDLGNGTYLGIKCRCDGYPSGVGTVLRENYFSEQKINQLLSLGDIFILGTTPDDQKSEEFWKTDPSDLDPEWTITERKTEPEHDARKLFKTNLLGQIDRDIKYLYFWESNQWHCCEVEENNEEQKCKEVLIPEGIYKIKFAMSLYHISCRKKPLKLINQKSNFLDVKAKHSVASGSMGCAAADLAQKIKATAKEDTFVYCYWRNHRESGEGEIHIGDEITFPPNCNYICIETISGKFYNTWNFTLVPCT